ncbi:hypothetical protein EX30DRAFT_228382 [Ascodesmis nigricans]|uniref:Uncharacterized protein n=1 Tax=Ascodesmis nigricans TaxID=341454 RepID=A0A4S2MIV7_9PEZI|nr:hypothetical protein EX30DRAFT_228382 [Ascodesmis nigricans]
MYNRGGGVKGLIIAMPHAGAAGVNSVGVCIRRVHTLYTHSFIPKTIFFAAWALFFWTVENHFLDPDF